MPLVRSRAPVVDTSQEPRLEPKIIWVDEPPHSSLDGIAIPCWLLILATAAFFGWQLLVCA